MQGEGGGGVPGPFLPPIDAIFGWRGLVTNPWKRLLTFTISSEIEQGPIKIVSMSRNG